MVDANTKLLANVGRRLRIIRRDMNGQNSALSGGLLSEDSLSFTIKTDRGEERTEPKIFCTVEWLSVAKEGV